MCFCRWFVCGFCCFLLFLTKRHSDCLFQFKASVLFIVFGVFLNCSGDKKLLLW